MPVGSTSCNCNQNNCYPSGISHSCNHTVAILFLLPLSPYHIATLTLLLFKHYIATDKLLLSSHYIATLTLLCSGGSNPIKTELRTLRTFENRTPNPSELWVLAQNRTPNPPNSEKTELEPEPVRVRYTTTSGSELSELLKTELRTHPNSGF